MNRLSATPNDQPITREAACRNIFVTFCSAFITGLLLFISGCASNSGRTDVSAPLVNSRNPDDFLVVDCLLPGQIRQLGQSFTFLTPRQPIKTTAFDCGLRGGEFTAYNRASYQTALKVWLPQAEQGNPEAQTYVGEIYEKGLGVAPDYEKAAFWYKKAADQGSSRARINLGYLYEKGLGVDQDVATALNFYRNASGLTDDNLTFESTVEIESKESTGAAREQIEALQREFENSRLETEALRKKLAGYESQLSKERNRLNQALEELEKARRKTKLLESQPSADPQSGRNLDQQRQQLEQAQAEVLAERARMKSLEQKFQQETNTLTSQLENTEAKASSYKQRLEQGLNAPTQTADAQSQAAREAKKRREDEFRALEAKLAGEENRLRTKLNKTLDELDAANKKLASVRNQPASSKVDQEVKKLQRDLEAKQAETTRLLKERNKEVDALKAKIREIGETARVSEVEPAHPNTPPKIVLLDPSLTAIKTRGQNELAVKLRSAAPSRQIVGRAEAAAGILSFMINDRPPENLDNSGLFKTTVRLEQPQTPVNITLIDKNGSRATLDFIMIPGTASSTGTQQSGKGKENLGKLASDINFGSYHALLIGNENYAQLPTLNTPIDDVREIDAILRKKYKFQTTVLTNANRYDILSALNKLRGELTEKSNLLIYYAGHGEIDKANQRGQWLPVDAELDNNANWISTSAITEIINTMSVKHIMIVADSCYSGAMTRTSLASLDPGMSSEKKVEWLKTMTLAKSRTVLTSGGVKPVLDSGTDGHSIFAKAFINALNRNSDILEGQILYRQISGTVKKDAKRLGFDQSPQYGPIRHTGHEAGEFFFVPA